MKKGVVFLEVIALMFCFLSACSSAKSNKAEKYIGVWYGYKVSTDESDIVFEDYAGLVKMELTAEFTSDGKYTLHYYVNGSEGEQYPQEGRYKIDEGKIILTENEGVGKIVDGELVLSFKNGAVKQYFKSNKESVGEKTETSENNKVVMVTIDELPDRLYLLSEERSNFESSIKETKDGYTFEVIRTDSNGVEANVSGQADNNKNVKSVNVVFYDVKTSLLHDLSTLEYVYKNTEMYSEEVKKVRFCCINLDVLCDLAIGDFSTFVDFNDWYKLFNGESYIFNNWRITANVDESSGKVTLNAIMEE